MGNRIHDLGIDRLPVAERIALVQDIWDSLADDAALLPLGAPEEAELDRRLVEDEATPDDITTWETIKDEALSRWRR